MLKLLYPLSLIWLLKWIWRVKLAISLNNRINMRRFRSNWSRNANNIRFVKDNRKHLIVILLTRSDIIGQYIYIYIYNIEKIYIYEWEYTWISMYLCEYINTQSNTCIWISIKKEICRDQRLSRTISFHRTFKDLELKIVTFLSKQFSLKNSWKQKPPLP